MVDESVHLGSAYGDIQVDMSQVQQQLGQAIGEIERQTGNAMQNLGRSIGNMGDQISGAGAKITLLMAPLAAMQAAGVAAYGSFDDALSEIQARTGATADVMEAVRLKAIQMGQDTAFSATQSADAMLQLLSSGYDIDETFSALPATLAAAAAGGMDLGFTADVITDALAMFNLEAGDAARVADALARGAGASSAEMNDLSAGLGNVGPLAAEFGLSIEETTAILAAFSERGIKGAEAGTALKSMLTNMSSGTAPVTAAWERLGISMFDATGTMRPMGELMRDIGAAMEDMTQEERTALIKDLGGSYGQLGLSVLTSSDALGDMTVLMSEQADAATVAEGRLNSLNGKLGQLKSSITTALIIAMQDSIEQGLKPLIDSVVEMINGVSAWMMMNPELTNQLVRMMSIALVVGPTLLIVGKAMSLIGAAIAVAASPLGLFVGLLYALYEAWNNNFLGLQDTLAPVMENIGAWIESATASFKNAIQLIKDSDLGGAMDALLTPFGFVGESIDNITLKIIAMQAFFERAISGIISIVDRGALVIKSGMSMIVGDWSDILSAINNLGGAGFDFGFIDGVVNLAMGIRSIVDRVADTFTRIRDAVLPVLTEIGIFVSNNMGKIAEFVGTLFEVGRTILALTNPVGVAMTILRLVGVDILDIFEQVFSAVGRFFAKLNEGGTAIEALQAAVNNDELFAGLIGAFESVRDFIENKIVPAVKIFADTLQGIWDYVSPGLDALGNWFINDIIPQVVSIITDSVVPLIGAFIDTLVDLWEVVSPYLLKLGNWFLTEVLPDVMTFISETVLPAIQGFIDILTKIWTDVSPFLVKLANWFLEDILPQIQGFIEDTIIPMIETFIGVLSDIWVVVKPFLSSLYEWFMKTGLPAIQQFVQGTFSGALNDLITLLSGLWESVKTGIENFKTNLEAAFNWIVTNVINPVKTAFDNIANGIQNAINKIQEFLGIQSGIQSTGDTSWVDDWSSSYGQNSGSRDMGGPGYPGQAYRIGSNVTEWFVPSVPGNFVLDKDMGGDKTTINGGINMVFEGGPPATQQEAAGAVDRMVNELRKRGITI